MKPLLLCRIHSMATSSERSCRRPRKVLANLVKYYKRRRITLVYSRNSSKKTNPEELVKSLVDGIGDGKKFTSLISRFQQVVPGESPQSKYVHSRQSIQENKNQRLV